MADPNSIRPQEYLDIEQKSPIRHKITDCCRVTQYPAGPRQETSDLSHTRKVTK